MKIYELRDKEMTQFTLAICPICRKEHKNLEIIKLEPPAFVNLSLVTHFVTCPTRDEPVYIRYN